MVSDKRLKRTRSALDELESGEMSIEPNPDGTFEVKGDHTVDLEAGSCSCPDYEYRVEFCKHLMAVRLQAMWGNIDADDVRSARPERPDVLSPELSNIPDSLRQMDQWVCWTQKLHENKDGTQRWTKVPVSPVKSGFASSTDAATWGTFRESIGVFNDSAEVVGVGVVISDDDDLIGIDIDDCREPKSGAMDGSVLELLKEVDTYAEVSPSGTGIRIFVRGESAFPSDCEADLPGEAHIEMYTTGRYLTVTGRTLSMTPDEVRNDTDTIAEFDERTRAEV